MTNPFNMIYTQYIVYSYRQKVKIYLALQPKMEYNGTNFYIRGVFYVAV